MVEIADFRIALGRMSGLPRVWGVELGFLDGGKSFPALLTPERSREAAASEPPRPQPATAPEPPQHRAGDRDHHRDEDPERLGPVEPRGSICRISSWCRLGHLRDAKPWVDTNGLFS